MFKNWLSHVIIDVDKLDSLKLASTFSKLKILVLHNYEEDDQFCANKTPHYHALGLPKYKTTHAFRDTSITKLQADGIDLTYNEKIDYLNNRFVKFVQSMRQYENTLNYLRKYNILIENESVNFDDNLKTEEEADMATFDKLEESLRPRKISSETLKKFRAKYPCELDWKRTISNAPLTSRKASTTDFYQQCERECRAMERAAELSEEERTEISTNHLEFTDLLCAIYSKLRDHIEVNQDNGSILILCGPSGSFKSNICQIIGKQMGECVTMMGRDFVSRDTLKFDSLVKKQCEVLNIEEMPWRNPAQRIGLTDTLNELKMLTTGDPIEVRCAKNQKMSEATIKLKLILISTNETKECNYNDLESIIQSTPEYKRRMVLIHMDDVNYKHVPKKTNFKNHDLFVKYLNSIN